MQEVSSKKIEYWLIFQNDQLLILNQQKVELLTNKDIAAIKSKLMREYYLIELDHAIVYCAEAPADLQIGDKFNAITLRKALETLETDWYNIAAKAYSIITWDKNHYYCGRCAMPTVHTPHTFERKCLNCHLHFYPRISPSIIVLIHKGDEILMARSPHFAPGVYGLIAGFVEAGENIEDAVHREVKEEVGLNIKNLKYFGSQAWPFPDSLMISFFAEYDSNEININPAEITEAAWYHYDQLPYRPTTSISIAKKLVEHFILKKQGRAHESL